MPEATFNNHRTATRTQRPASTAMRPDPPRPHVATSPLLRRAACPDAIGVASSAISLRRFVASFLRRYFYLFQTNPFVSPTAILVSRPAPYRIVKLGRASKPGRARVPWSSAAPPCSAGMMTCRRLRLGHGTERGCATDLWAAGIPMRVPGYRGTFGPRRLVRPGRTLPIDHNENGGGRS